MKDEKYDADDKGGGGRIKLDEIKIRAKENKSNNIITNK